MKLKKNVLLVFGAIAPCCFGAYAQGTFWNLDFERARPILRHDCGIPCISRFNAIPGWTAALGEYEQDIIPYNFVSLGSPMLSLQGYWYVAPQIPVPLIQGYYSLLFQASVPGGAMVPSITQTGRLSQETRSLTFKTSSGIAYAHFDVFFEDVALPTTRLAVTDEYELWGADISDFSGDYGRLTFRGEGELDDIQFSPLEIPEPAAWSILLVGGAIIARFQKRT